MALFINGVGQDTFNMNGVSIDNLYVDGVLVWTSIQEVAGIPRYELTEALVDTSTIDDSANTASDYNGLLTESDGTTPYEPTVLQYPQNGLLELASGRIMDTQYTRQETDAQYGIYDADGSTTYKIWAIEHDLLQIYKVYEGDQDTPLTLTSEATLTIPQGTMKITDGRPSWLPSLAPVYGPELIQGGGNDNGVLDAAQFTIIAGNSYEAVVKVKLTESCINYFADPQYSGQYQAFTTEIGETYEVNVRIAGESETNGEPLAGFTRVSIIDSIPSAGTGGELITSSSLSWEDKTADYVATGTTSYFVIKNSNTWRGGNLAMISVKKRT